MINNSKDFQDFIQTKHCEQYIGCKDNCVEDYESWVDGLDFEDFIHYGNLYGVERSLITLKNIKQNIMETLAERTNYVETKD